MPTKKTKPHRPVSVERLFALALVEVLDELKANPEWAALMNGNITKARKLLADHGYGNLESISSRVAKVELELQKALEAKDGSAIERLGRELRRAQKGLAPIVKKVAVPKVKKDPKPPQEAKPNGLSETV